LTVYTEGCRSSLERNRRRVCQSVFWSRAEHFKTEISLCLSDLPPFSSGGVFLYHGLGLVQSTYMTEGIELVRAVIILLALN
jgi:hypothetical protein